MKLVIAIVQDQDAHDLIENLLKKDFRATKLASTGGLLREGNSTILVGVEKERVDEVIELVKESCSTRQQLISPVSAIGRSIHTFLPSPVEITVGGATVFVLDVDQFVKV
ncbi:MAG: cyclic-di-AMP receptor [Firmicutes bacterium]|nr:cyclic-di-AMP receptor [Bacillota bacterium]